MSKILTTANTGRAWLFGDDIDTDALAPGRYMKHGIEVIAAHCLESIDADFAANAAAGDIVIGGHNFGMGSSREQAPQALQHLGVSAIVAQSFAGLFYRNAINLGLPALIGNATAISPGERLAIDIESARLTRLDNGQVIQCEPLPAFLLAIISDGGLIANLKKRLTATDGQQPA